MSPSAMSSAMPSEMPAIPLPPEPQTIEQTGLTLGFLADLALKTLYLRGQMSMADIASALGLSITGVTDKIMEFLKTERLVEIRGGADDSTRSLPIEKPDDHFSEIAFKRQLTPRPRRSKVRKIPTRRDEAIEPALMPQR